MSDIHIQWTSHRESETIALGRAVGAAAVPGDRVLLDGALGAGKTRFVRGLAIGMGHDPDGVSSPTFVMINEYQHEGLTPLVHADAYRLSGPDDLESLGWDVADDGGAVVAIEWAERIAGALPGDALAIRIGHDADDSRRFRMTVPQRWIDRRAFSDVLRVTGAAMPSGWTRCPVTERPVHPESPTFPFWDEQARMADLGRWLTGSYSISRELQGDDLDDPDLGSV